MIGFILALASEIVRVFVRLLSPAVTPTLQEQPQHATQTPPLLRHDDHLILRYYVAIMRVCRPVFVQVLQLLTNNSSNLKQLLFDLPSYSNTQYKREFTVPERERLDNNMPFNEYDISLLFKLLQRICGLASKNDDKWVTPGTLEYNLRLLKDQRNDLAHENLTLTQRDAESRFSLLEALCQSVLMAAGSKCGRHVADEVRNMQEQLEEVLTANVDLWQSEREALHQLRQEHRNILTREGKREIREVAQNLRILNPFVWLLEDRFAHMDVGSIYADVYLDIDTHRQVKTQGLFKPQLSSGQYPSVLIIDGPPGIGKTSLVRFLLNDWVSAAFSVIGIFNFDLVLPVELRYVTSSSLQELLCEEIIPKACHHLAVTAIIPTLQELSVLWLVDGFDEATGSTMKLVKELLRKFPNAKMVITTRPECVNELELLVNGLHLSHVTYHIQGFLPDQWMEYAQKLFSVSVGPENKRRASCMGFLQFMKPREQSMWEIFSVPLFVAMLVTLWLEDPAVVTAATTSTKLYCTLLDLTINRMIRRLHVTESNLMESQLWDKINCFLDLLGVMLWGNIQSSNYILFDYQIKEIEDYCNNLGLPFRESLSPFFLVLVNATTTGTVQEYRPLHNTVHEFLAARAFCNAMITQDCDILTLAAQWKHKYRKTQDRPMPRQRHPTNFVKKLNNKERFVMKKLHEGSDSVFEDCDITIGSCFCASDIGPYLIEEGSEEFERFHCDWYFHTITGGTLVLHFMCGYLKMKNALTQARAEQIIYVAMCDVNSVRKYSLWLNFVHETGQDSVILQELSRQLSPYQWILRAEEFFLVEKLLSFVIPESLYMHFCSGLSMVDQNRGIFTKHLSQFSAFPVNISLSLQINELHIFSQDDQLFAQDCLSILLRREASCHLTELYCPLNKHSAKLLCVARHLENLKVKVYNIEDLVTLAHAVNNSQSLNYLDVYLGFNITSEPISVIPTFNLRRCVRLHQEISLNKMITMLPSPLVQNIVYQDEIPITLQQPISHEDQPQVRMNIQRKVEFQSLNNEQLKPHPCTSPKLTSHKLLKLKKVFNTTGKAKTDIKTLVAVIPYPLHLKKFRTNVNSELYRKSWNLPSAHCHRQCSMTNSEPLLCHDHCCHFPLSRPGDTLIFAARTKREWLHHHKAIRYHQTSIKKLRVFYKKIWSIICDTHNPDRSTYKKSYDCNIKMVCYSPRDQQMWDKIEDVNIILLKVCELYIYEHKISIQHHRRLLTHVREPSSQLSSPVRLTFTDTFITDPQKFSAVVHRLCESPLSLFMRDFQIRAPKLGLKDFLRYVWCTARVVPSVQVINMELPVFVDNDPSQEPIVQGIDRDIKFGVENSAPRFNFNLYWFKWTKQKEQQPMSKSETPTT